MATNKKSLNDSAYAIFENFYHRLAERLNEIHLQDTTDFSSLVFVDETGNPVPVSSNLSIYRNKLRENGFGVSMTEGSTYIQQDRDFISVHFYPFVSSTMKDYLEKLNKENKEGFSEDGGLVITPTELAKRIIWREEFLKNHSAFLFLDQLKESHKAYLTFLLEGMDNTPLFDFENEDSLSPDFRKAFEFLLTKHPTTSTTGVVKPYYLAIKNNQKQKAQQYLQLYRKEGLIMGD